MEGMCVTGDREKRAGVCVCVGDEKELVLGFSENETTKKWVKDNNIKTHKHGFPLSYVCTCLLGVDTEKKNKKHAPRAVSFTHPHCHHHTLNTHTHTYRCTTSRRGKTLATTTAKWRQRARQRAHECACTSDVGHEEHHAATHNARTRVHHMVTKCPNCPKEHTHGRQTRATTFASSHCG